MASLAKRKRAAPTAMCGVALPWEVGDLSGDLSGRRRFGCPENWSLFDVIHTHIHVTYILIITLYIYIYNIDNMI